MVTNTLGNGAFGSLLWATVLAANAGDTIRFDPSIAGDTIFMDNTLVVPMIRQQFGWIYLDIIDPNGGPSWTQALEAGSLAINNGKNCTFSVDQRYVPRDGKCDIGAFEFTDFTRATLVVTANVNVDAARGIAMFTGTAKCSANSPDRLVPNDLPLRVKLTQEQKGGGKPVVVSASTTITVKCGLTTTSWGVPLPPPASDKQWKDGAAVAQLEADPVLTPQWIAPASVSAPVKLIRPRK